MREPATSKLPEYNHASVLKENSSTVNIDVDEPHNSANELFGKAKELILRMNMPITESDVANTLQISNNQTRIWLRRLVEEGILKKKQKPVRYIAAEERQVKLINDS
jgi:hypothetical protein